ncbi:YqaJ viral recombinase family protein [Gordonia malaquae]|uniref:YqaJ viral recombinase family protein n=1 Tax=Gordonia malaquae TaxID=410332 RepID=UPI0030166259
MTYTEYPLEQGTDEWLQARCGMVTASFIDGLIATRKLTAIDHECPACAAPANEPCISARGGEPIKSLHPDRAAVARSQSSPTIIEAASNETSRDITVRLAAERITGRIDPVFVTDDMWRGTVEEPLARDKYHHNYAPVRELGFMVRDIGGARIGYSPDGLVDDGNGLIEIKSRRPKKHVKTVVADTAPIENMAQMQTGLLVSGRDWCDYISYSGGMAMWVKRVFPDPRWQKAIVDAARRAENGITETVRVYAAATEGLVMTELTDLTSELEIKVA